MGIHSTQMKQKVLPRFELGLLDSESRVLTVTPQDHVLDEVLLETMFRANQLGEISVRKNTKNDLIKNDPTRI